VPPRKTGERKAAARVDLVDAPAKPANPGRPVNVMRVAAEDRRAKGGNPRRHG
jgi:hypothetical protein